jgi:hypothetical protein
MATLTSRLVISLSDRVSGPARAIAGSLKRLQSTAAGAAFATAGRQANRAGTQFMRAGASAFTAAYGVRAIIEPTREFNDAVWGTTAALLGTTKALKPAQAQAEDLRKTAIDLSKQYGVMPEVFAKAGMEATKMGLDHKKASSVMEAAGKVWMSDKDVDPSAMAKSLGTYGIVYGAPEDEEAYRTQTMGRASSLALAGAKTRTSASALEEGLRNYMGVHGAFGGKFEDAVALIAMGSNVALMEKETGTALKSLTSRFLRMPAEGRAAMAGAGIDTTKFMDFSAVSPLRATGQLVQLFPGQLKKGARGNTLKFLEKAERDGRLKDPAIIGQVLEHLEKQGLKFAGAEDRDIALTKISSVMSGAGGNFDPLGFFAEISRAVKDGRAGPGILGLIGEPKRLQQYLALNHVLEDTVALRDELVSDQGRFLGLVAEGYSESDAGKITAMEAAWRRFQLTLIRSDGLMRMLSTLQGIADAFAGMPSWASSAVGGMLAFGAILAPIGFAIAGIVAGLRSLMALGKGIALLGGLGGAAAGGSSLFGLGAGAAGGAAAAKASANMIKGMGASRGLMASGQMIAGMSAAGAGAGAATAKTVGKGLIARLIPGVGWALTAASLGTGAYAGYEDYQKNGDLWSAAKAAGWGALTLGTGAANAAETSPASTVAAAGPAVASGQADGGLGNMQSQASQIPGAIAGAMAQVRSIVAGVDLTAEGTRIANTLANGIRAGIGSISSAAGAAASAASAGASMNGAFSDGAR